MDIRGRSRTLRVNYRTSHQIRQQADRLLGAEVSDVDGIAERRGGTVSVFNGPTPEIRTFRTEADETNAVAKWVAAKQSAGYQPQEIGVFVRSEAELPRARGALVNAGLPYRVLDEKLAIKDGEVAVRRCTSRRASSFGPWR